MYLANFSHFALTPAEGILAKDNRLTFCHTVDGYLSKKKEQWGRGLASLLNKGLDEFMFKFDSHIFHRLIEIFIKKFKVKVL